MKQLLKSQIKWWSFSLIVTLASWELGAQINAQPLPATDAVLLSQQSGHSSTSNISARELFRQAYENRYTWNQEFPGYRAAVEFKQGKENYKGRVRVNPDLSVEVTGIENEEARQTVENQLRMLVVHRRPVPFEVAHKNSTFKLGNTDRAGAVEIYQQGETEARYQVQERQIKQVNRLLGPHAVTVDTLETNVTPKGYIATRYRTTLHQPQTKQVLGVEETQDTYEQLGGYYVLDRHVVQHSEAGESYTAQFNYSDIQLLPAKS